MAAVTMLVAVASGMLGAQALGGPINSTKVLLDSPYLEPGDPFFGHPRQIACLPDGSVGQRRPKVDGISGLAVDGKGTIFFGAGMADPGSGYQVMRLDETSGMPVVIAGAPTPTEVDHGDGPAKQAHFAHFRSLCVAPRRHAVRRRVHQHDPQDHAGGAGHDLGLLTGCAARAATFMRSPRWSRGLGIAP